MTADGEDDVLDVAALEAAGFRRNESPTGPAWGWVDPGVVSGPAAVAAVAEPTGHGTWDLTIFGADLRCTEPMELATTADLREAFAWFASARAEALPDDSPWRHRRTDKGDVPLDEAALTSLGFAFATYPCGRVGGWEAGPASVLAMPTEGGGWRFSVTVLGTDPPPATLAWLEAGTLDELLEVFASHGVHPLHRLAAIAAVRIAPPEPTRSRGARTPRAGVPPRTPGRDRRW